MTLRRTMNLRQPWTFSAQPSVALVLMALHGCQPGSKATDTGSASTTPTNPWPTPVAWRGEVPLHTTFALYWSTDIGSIRVRDVEWIDIYGRDARMGIVTAERGDLLSPDISSQHRQWVPTSFGYSNYVYTQGNGSVGVAVGDVDNDYDDDRVSWTDGEFDEYVGISTNTGGNIGGNGTAHVGYLIQDVALGDLNGDQYLDLAVVHSLDQRLQMFSLLVYAVGSDLALDVSTTDSVLTTEDDWIDNCTVAWNPDRVGPPEVALAVEDGFLVYRRVPRPAAFGYPQGEPTDPNETPGFLEPVFIGGPPSRCGALTYTDADGDGDSDLLATPRDAPAQLWTREGDRLTWTWMSSQHECVPTCEEWYATDYFNPYEDCRASCEVAASDLDQDGDQDFVVSGETRVTVYANDGAGHYSVAWLQSGVWGAVAVRDHDRDGDLDLVVGGEVLAVFDNVPL
jgi:FG-GAP-like repeat